MFGRALASRFLIALALFGIGAAGGGFSEAAKRPTPAVTAEPALLFAAVPFASVRAHLTGGKGAETASLLSPLSTLPLMPLADRPIARLQNGIVR